MAGPEGVLIKRFHCSANTLFLPLKRDNLYNKGQSGWSQVSFICRFRCIGYTPRARLLSDLATECHRHEVAKSLGNQARGVQPACTMTTQNSKIRLISSIALKSRLITYLST